MRRIWFTSNLNLCFLVMQPEAWLAATLPLKLTNSEKLQHEESEVTKLLI